MQLTLTSNVTRACVVCSFAITVAMSQPWENVFFFFARPYVRSSWTQVAAETLKRSIFLKLRFCYCFAYISLVWIFNLLHLKIHSHEIPMAMLLTPPQQCCKAHNFFILNICWFPFTRFTQCLSSYVIQTPIVSIHTLTRCQNGFLPSTTDIWHRNENVLISGIHSKEFSQGSLKAKLSANNCDIIDIPFITADLAPLPMIKYFNSSSIVNAVYPR